MIGSVDHSEVLWLCGVLLAHELGLRGGQWVEDPLCCDNLRSGGGNQIHGPGCVFRLLGQRSHRVARQGLCDWSDDCRLR